MAVCVECKKFMGFSETNKSIAFGGKCLNCANKVNTQLASTTLADAEKNQSITKIHKTAKNTEIKKRMWGTFCVAICMIILGLISREILNKPTAGIVALLWFAILWNSATGNVNAVKNIAKLAMIIQSAGIIFLVIVVGINDYINVGNAFIPLLVWGLVYLNANAVYKRISVLDNIEPKIHESNSNTSSSNSKSYKISDNIDKQKSEDVKPKVLSDEPDDHTPKVVSISGNWASFTKAQTVIEYNSKAASAWKEINKFPDSLKHKFIETLEKNPKTDITKLKSKIKTEYKKLINPFDNDELNLAYAKALKEGKSSAEEFIRVYDLLGDTVSPKHLLKGVLEKTKYLKFSNEQIEALEYAVNNNYFNEVLDCLIKLDYILDPINPEKVGTLHNYSDYNITNREGLTLLVKNSGILHFSRTELEKLKQKI
jgi:hypothetical protein